MPPNPAPVPIESIKKDDFEAQELEHVSVPIFAVAPSDQKIAKGKTCRISIRVSGKPRPFVTWFKDGEYIFDDGRRCFTVQENGDESLIMANIGNFSDPDIVSKLFLPRKRIIPEHPAGRPTSDHCT